MDDVQSFRFGMAEPQTPVSLSGMDRLGERMARRLRVLFETIVGTKPVITAQTAEMVNYDLWSAMAPGFGALSTYRLHPLKGTILVRLEADMVSAVVDRFYGGSGTRPRDPQRHEFTRSEDRILARLSDSIMDAMAKNWADVLPMEPSLIARETDPQSLALAEASDQLLSQCFKINFGKGEGWTIELMLPVVALRQLEPLLSTGGGEDHKHKDPLWQSRMARQMGEIRLPARTVLARPSLTLSELLNLRNGDVIPVNIARSLPLIVGHRVIAHGNIGEQNGRAAFLIESIAKDQTQ